MKTNVDDELTPCIVGSECLTSGSRDKVHVGVGLPSDLVVVLADVLVLDVGVGRDIHSDCETRDQ